ncbi:RICIN domain-containing protein [Youngiibacter multivorans]|uniref:Repeat protein (TIGR02543 family) n=1 Tax=Youngiibacter multivorans TaxID=937251 RepID=A0ABS4G372_9CLOT|nr:RICIN domain-containing protein [Youngiibacter multivorans]MBP1919008.1 putative repeat protein (TIGR02543 family) [Youngiibacter multivorans]
MKKRLFALVTLICMMFNLNIMPLKSSTVYAETTIIASGTCGSNLKWVLDSLGVLNISGSGNMDNYTSINGYISSPFSQLSWQIKSATIENGVTSIGDYAFYDCFNLTSISLPEGLSSIGNLAFKGCSSLTSISLPEGLTSIGNYAFKGCSSFTNIILPEGLTSIGRFAFEDCSSVTLIILPESVTSIGDYAFNKIYKWQLKFIVVPNSYAYNYVLNNGLYYQYLVDPNIKYSTDSFLSFRDDYLYLKPLEIRSLSELINYSTDIPFENILFSVLDDSITMISDGKIAGIGEGSCTVNATYGNLSDSFNVVVSASENSISATGISLSEDALTINKGLKIAVKATIEPVTATDRTVTWTTSDMSVVTIQNGVITSVAPGTATVTASINGYSDSIAITVNAPLLALGVDDDDFAVNKNETHKIYCYHYPYYTTDDKTVTYTSSDESIATVDSKGIVTGISLGTATILLTNGSIQKSVNVTVTSRLTGISLNKTSINGIKNSSEQIFVNYDPVDTTDDKTITWSSDNASIAAVDSTGLVSYISKGITTITATVESYSAKCTVIVTEIPLISISLNYSEIDLLYADTISLAVAYEPSNTTDDKSITWTSSDELVATVSSDGTVTAIGNGTATITATTADGNKTASCMVIVAVPVIGVTLDRSELSFTKFGQTDKLIATVAPSNAANQNVTWTSSNESVATVDKDGTVKAVGNGTVTVTVATEDGKKTASCVVTVKDYSGEYHIQSKKSNLVMDVYGGGRDIGTNIIQWRFHGGLNQQWRFESLGNGYYKVTSVLNPTYSLDVYRSGTEIGTNVIQWTYHGGPNQQWKIIENVDGSVSLMSRLAEESGTGYILDVYGGGMDEGVNVIQWTAHYGDNQKWYLEPVQDYTMNYENNGGSAVVSSIVTTGHLVTEPQEPTREGMIFKGWFKDTALTIPWDFAADKMPAQDTTLYAKWMDSTYSVIFDSQGGSAIETKKVDPDTLITPPEAPTKTGYSFCGWYKEADCINQWNFDVDTVMANTTLYAKWIKDWGGTYFIRSKKSNLVMDVFGGGTEMGTNIIQWSYHGGLNQQWKFESLENGYYKITSVLNPQYSLDVYGGGTDLGNRVIQWNYHGGINQQWKIIENDDGSVSLMSRLAEESGTGYLLDVYGGGMDAGVNVIQWTAHYGDNQRWYLESVN